MKYLVWIPVAYFILEYMFFIYSIFLIDFTPKKKKNQPTHKGALAVSFLVFDDDDALMSLLR